jgi:hypothetical protein
MAIGSMVREGSRGGGVKRSRRGPKENDVGLKLVGIAVVLLAAVACEQQGLATAEEVALSLPGLGLER